MILISRLFPRNVAFTFLFAQEQKSTLQRENMVTEGFILFHFHYKTLLVCYIPIPELTIVPIPVCLLKF